MGAPSGGVLSGWGWSCKGPNTYCGILCIVEVALCGWMNGWMDGKEAFLPISELICALQWMDFRGGGGE